MRCVCCNRPFTPAMKESSKGEVTFETLCSICKSSAFFAHYSPDYNHEYLTEKPVELTYEDFS